MNRITQIAWFALAASAVYQLAMIAHTLQWIYDVMRLVVDRP